MLTLTLAFLDAPLVPLTGGLVFFTPLMTLGG
jgi:hypothetical protein